MTKLEELRREYHAAICRNAIFLKEGGIPNMADGSSRISSRISQNLLKRLPYPTAKSPIEGQTSGKIFEDSTKVFLE